MQLIVQQQIANPNLRVWSELLFTTVFCFSSFFKKNCSSCVLLAGPDGHFWHCILCTRLTKSITWSLSELWTPGEYDEIIWSLITYQFQKAQGILITMATKPLYNPVEDRFCSGSPRSQLSYCHTIAFAFQDQQINLETPITCVRHTVIRPWSDMWSHQSNLLVECCYPGSNPAFHKKRARIGSSRSSWHCTDISRCRWWMNGYTDNQKCFF